MGDRMAEHFGTTLRTARLAAGLTQIELARGIMSSSQLSLLEQGKRRPSVDSVTQLATRLEIPESRLCPTVEMIGRVRPEGRLEQGRRALLEHNYASAERIATQVLSGRTNAERRMRAYVLRAEAREAMRMPRAAFDDLGLALDIARRRPDSRDFVDIAFSRERLRHQLLSDDAA